MAETFIQGENGSVTLPSTHGGRAFAFTVQAEQNTKDVSRYGGGRFREFYGGLIQVSGRISVFLRKGATGTPAGITSLEREGAALTLTADTGVTLGGTALITGFNMNHAFDDPVINGDYDYRFTSTVTEAWATA